MQQAHRRLLQSGPLEDLYVEPESAAAAVVGAPEAPAPAVAHIIGAHTAATRADINKRIGDLCENIFDELPALSKARLRGRADELFHTLAHGPLFPAERVAGGTVVNAVKDDKLNEPRHYTTEFSASDLRPEVLQVLIRTAQRLLNAQTLHQFARTRGEHAAAEIAEGVTTKAFLVAA